MGGKLEKIIIEVDGDSFWCFIKFGSVLLLVSKWGMDEQCSTKRSLC